MSYELFEQGPAEYVPILLVSLIITMAAYGVFPLIFAKTRKKTITKRKYRVLCYCINFAVMVLFIIINGEASTGGPYILWTWVFSAFGIRTLESRSLLEGWPPEDNVKTISQTSKEGRLEISEEAALPTEGEPPVELSAVEQPKRPSNSRKQPLTLLAILSVLLAASIGFNVMQHLQGKKAIEVAASQTVKIEELEAEISSLTAEIRKLERTVADQKIEIAAKEWAIFSQKLP